MQLVWKKYEVVRRFQLQEPFKEDLVIKEYTNKATEGTKDQMLRAPLQISRDNKYLSPGPGRPEYSKQLHSLFVQKDEIFRKHLRKYAKTLKHGFGVEPHEVDAKEFQHLPHWLSYTMDYSQDFSVIKHSGQPSFHRHLECNDNNNNIGSTPTIHIAKN